MQAISRELLCSQGVTACDPFDRKIVQQFKKDRQRSMLN